jgi:hypothetical protein
MRDVMNGWVCEAFPEEVPIELTQVLARCRARTLQQYVQAFNQFVLNLIWNDLLCFTRATPHNKISEKLRVANKIHAVHVPVATSNSGSWFSYVNRVCSRSARRASLPSSPAENGESL